MYFDYLKTSQYTDSIEIESVGNCIIQSINDEADSWVLKIKTELGFTYVLQAGPINLDFEKPGNSIFISKSSFEYNEKKLYKIIHDFINNPKHVITCVEIIDEDIFKNILNKIIDYI